MSPTTITHYGRHLVWQCAWWLTLASATLGLAAAPATGLCRIVVTDAENGWPVPLVELKTVNQTRFVTDNAGVIAFNLPEFMNRETWFSVSGHGYEVNADGFGYRGVRLTPQPGATLPVSVHRTSIAQRLGRLTGSGLFSDSQQLGDHLDWNDGPIVGCDSVQLAVYREKLFWAWGDTQVARYPLGIFDASSATTSRSPLERFQPPLQVQYDYFNKPDGSPRGVAPLPGKGPTWLTAYMALLDKSHQERLVATYRKITPPLSTYEIGLCAWDDAAEEFRLVKKLWEQRLGQPEPRAVPDGHPSRWTDSQGRAWLLFGSPLPNLRCPATFEAWQDPTTWEVLSPPDTLPSKADGRPVKLHSGSIAWNDHRQKWVTVFMQHFGKTSAFGALWYAEAREPLGEWSPAVPILAHDNYTFYNPRIQWELTPANASFLLFEATYTREFAKQPAPTAKYDYNQILYRLNLDDPRLHGQSAPGTIEP